MKTASLALPVLAVLVLSGCAVNGHIGAESTPTPTAFVASGTISVPIDISATIAAQGGDGATLGEACVSRDGYDDITSGAQVVVSDASDKKVAIGDLGDGLLVKGPTGSTKLYESRCEYPFRIKDVPLGSKIYSVHAGNEARGERSFTRGDLTDGIQLTIG
ncbi:hypothetical protein [Curtobacterium sp. ISL-83]|uniref:hypothetical protein n=1 Tax=Curtobacterium sp. ISL-83 TaxID=2819145 RepID=UPI001BEC0E6F|nr:hypothetical protein [Curtobacterium sp. ISL-83]MBT2501425.1 hypothetical protein [Curtobacterium sp. ISL-83]